MPRKNTQKQLKRNKRQTMNKRKRSNKRQTMNKRHIANNLKLFKKSLLTPKYRSPLLKGGGGGPRGRNRPRLPYPIRPKVKLKNFI